ncbi:DNA helicase UvrD [Marinobacter sp. C18]|uniref:ATP-dependent helicase n=1 Tax=Marinobacter sp. C18 TaxID=1772288 RepID=UPI000948AE8C|nr:ATP-dependent helicase [Marinobacter sp. C18]OLF81956.1 DNA helicase UvrD [Marinobacter sp. C18]
MADIQLSAQQEKIAEHQDGSLIVLAGAGSGKTATLVERVGRLISKGVNPRLIMLVTFSRKAAKEIKNRLADRFGMDGEDVVVDTFHGFGYRFLRQYKDMYGLKEDQDWVILTENEQRRLMNDIGKELADEANVEAKDLRKELKKGFSLWSLMKQSGICPGNVSDALIALEKIRCSQNGETPNHEQVTMLQRLTAQTLVQYEKDKRSGGYLDFDDLLLLPVRALKKYPEVAKGMALNHQYIMVDESQDTNAVQYWMTKAIAEHHGNLVMVGDDDQGIYTWRGARVANLKRFIEDFKAPIAKLEENYRSHSRIVQTAGNLIRHNRARLAKKPFSSNDNGPLPELRIANRDRQMADNIVAEIQERHEQGVPYNDMAILYRTNRMTTILEPAFRQAGVPYSVVGGMSFYERQEIQAITACVRVANKWDDWMALRTLQPYIDGLGKKGMNDTIQRMSDDGENLLSLAVHDAPQQFGKGAIILQTFMVKLLEAVHFDSANMSEAEVAQRLVQWTKDGPMKLLDREKDDTARVKRSENLDRLIHEIRETNPESFSDYMMEGPISDFIEATADTDRVTLSTIHRSKGLEWPHVFIAGMSDGLMPLDSGKMNGRPGQEKAASADTDDDDGGKPEEERRLAYVAATRAAETLTLHHAAIYHFPGGEPVVTDPSPFVEEMGLSLSPVQKAHLRSAVGEKTDFNAGGATAEQSVPVDTADHYDEPRINIFG